MITIQPEFNAESLKRDLGLISRSFGVNIEFICNDQMRLYCADMVRRSQPTARRASGDVKKGTDVASMSAKKIGERRVAIDINMIVLGMGGTKYEYSEQKDSDGEFVKMENRSTGAVHFVREENYDESGELGKVRERHKRSRDNRGRVRRRRRSSTVQLVGNKIVINKLHIQQHDKQRFIEQQQSRVGLLKAGFARGMAHFAREVFSNTRVPKWVARNMSASVGVGEGKVNPDNGRGGLSATNFVPYASAQISASSLAQARTSSS